MNLMDPSDVVDDTTLMEYMRQRLGCPSFVKDEVVFRKRSMDFRERNPQVDYTDLVRVVDWCKATNRRPLTLAGLFNLAIKAYSVGVLINAEAHRERTQLNDLYAVLQVENDPAWRQRIISSSGAVQRRVITEWKAKRSA